MSRYIDVDELWKEIESVEYYGRDAEVSRICGLIQNAPTAEVKPIVYGEWVAKNFHTVTCSNCNDFDLDIMKDYQFDKFLHCPNCGANMRKENEEAE